MLIWVASYPRSGNTLTMLTLEDVVRDGRDAIVSHAHFVKERDLPDFRDLSFDRRVAVLTRPGMRAYGDWSRNVRRWRRRRAPVAIIRFEELLRDPARVVARGCETIGVHLGDADGQLHSFDYLRERLPVLFRRGVVGGWRDEMAPELQERFWRVHGDEMEALGYRR